MTTTTDTRRPLRSALAILAGLIAGAGLSLGTDQVLHVLHVYPPWGQPMYDPGDNLLALAYRCVFSVLASYIAARLAPTAPMRHAMTLGVINLIVSTIGAVVTITTMDLGPDWYPISLAALALPCAWMGGVLYRARRSTVSAVNPLAASR